MKKNMRYGLIAVLILALLVVTALAASAADEVELYDDNDDLVSAYDSLQDAVDDADAEYVIKLVGDLTGVGEVTIADGKIITIDGDDHTITFAAAGGLVIGEDAEVLIQNVSLASTDDTATAVSIGDSAYEVVLSGVTISGFGTGVDVTTNALVTINSGSEISTASYCLNVSNASVKAVKVEDTALTTDADAVKFSGGSLTMTRVSFDRAIEAPDLFTGLALMLDGREDKTVALTDVTVTTNFAVGVKLTVVATMTVGGENTDFQPKSKCFWFDEGTYGGLVTVNNGTFRPTGTGIVKTDRFVGCFILAGAELIINDGTFYNADCDSLHGGALVWGNEVTNPNGIASPVTINGGTFLEQSAGAKTPIFLLYCPMIVSPGDSGRYYHSYCGDGRVLLTINDGTFRAVHEGGQSRGIIYVDNCGYGVWGHPEAYSDIVINGGEFDFYSEWSDQAMFFIKGAARLTINDGDFEAWGRAYLFAFANNLYGVPGYSVTHSIKGGTFEASQLLAFTGDTSWAQTIINFGYIDGEGNEVGPTVTTRKTHANASILLGWGAAHNDCSLNFFGGTYNITDRLTLDPNGEEIEQMFYSGSWRVFDNRTFICGYGPVVRFYGGTFNLQGENCRLAWSHVGSEMPSPFLFDKNPGKNGVTVNMTPTAGPVLYVMTGQFKNTKNKINDGRMCNDETHGNKLIMDFLAGTFIGGKEWIRVEGPAPIINFGIEDSDVGPIFRTNNDTFSSLFYFSAAAGVPTGATLTPAIVNFYSGTFELTGDNNTMFQLNGGVLNFYGGDFKVTNNAKLILMNDNDGVGNVNIVGGTFDLAGSGSILQFSALAAPNNTDPARATLGDVVIGGGTFKSTGEATGTFFIINGSYPGSFSISDVTFGPKTAATRYFSLGQLLPYTPTIDAGLVFPADPVKGLGGYTTSAVVGGYSAALTNKLFAGGQMVLTDNYELAIFWKLTEAQASAYTKTVITFEDGEPYEITAKEISDNYPDGSAVGAGYKVVKVVLDKITVRALGKYFAADLYVSDALLASADYSALEYIRKVGYATVAAKADALEADPEANVTAYEKTIGLLSSMTYVAFSVDGYVNRDLAVPAVRSGGFAFDIAYFNDRGFSRDSEFIPAFVEVEEATAVWTGEANTNANLTGTGLRFTDTIQFYVEFTATSLDGISVSYTVAGGEAEAARIVGVGGGKYRAYTQFTNLENLGKAVTFTLSGDTNAQTCTYSLQAFVYKYQNLAGTDANGKNNVKNIARHLYSFNLAVEAFYTAAAEADIYAA